MFDSTQTCLMKNHKISEVLSVNLLNNKSTPNNKKNPQQIKSLYDHCDEKFTIPIKQYSNKFLRQKQHEQQNHKLKPINRKIISQMKRYKIRNKRVKCNKENYQGYERMIQIDKDEDNLICNKNANTRITYISGWQNQLRMANQKNNQYNKDQRSINMHNQSIDVKKAFYDQICQKQKTIMPQYRKKCRTFSQQINNQLQSLQKQRKMQRTSTSRALEKYSKIVKINPQQGRLQKMKIKKQLAKSMVYQSCEKSNIQATKIRLCQKKQSFKQSLSRKQMLKTHNFILNTKQTSTPQTKSNFQIQLYTPQKDNQNYNQIFRNISNQKNYTSDARIAANKTCKVKTNKYCYKKCVTEFRINQSTEDYQINGWDVAF